jgi:hypothetical protein
VSHRYAIGEKMLLRLRQHCQSILLYRRRHSSQRIFREDARCSRLPPHRGGNLGPCPYAASKPATPGRGANGIAGTATTPGTTAANVARRTISLPPPRPRFCRCSRRATSACCWLVARSRRQPSATRATSLQALIRGIDGPTSLAAIRAALAELGLARDTNIIVAADHGISAISKECATSSTTKLRSNDTPARS